jgi:hypothetical protein
VTEELADVERRRILALTVTGLTGVGIELVGGAEPRLGTEPLDAVAGALERLRDLDGRLGAARVLVPATWLADRLGHLLVRTPSASALHGRLGALTADAALLASWAASEIADPGEALRYGAVAHHAARAIASPDLIAVAEAARAHSLDTGLGERDKALATVARISLDGTAAATRVSVEAHRGRLLARAGRAGPALRALDRAAEAVSEVDAEQAPRALGSITAEHVIKHRGHALVELGHPDEAAGLLGAALKRQPSHLLRGAGAIHARLAEAAMRTGEPERAARHVVAAHRALTRTRSTRRLADLGHVVAGLKAEFGKVRAVRDLEEELRGTSRYVLCRTSADGRRIHLRGCQYTRRGNAGSWAAAEDLTPAELAASRISIGYEWCDRCLPAPDLGITGR